MDKILVQPGTTPADEKFRIKILRNGPVMVYGRPPLMQQFIMPDSGGASWEWADGEQYEVSEPCALCRCGESQKKPFCDGAHMEADWYPDSTASEEPLLRGAEAFDGPELVLTDNQEYCAFARFCDAKGRVWNLVGRSDDPTARELTIREANYCCAGRLTAWEKETKKPHEPVYDPSLVLIEDPAIRCSGGIFVRGGIRVEREDGFVYEIRNRAVICRCGQSSNKPWCDGTHASMKFRDGLNPMPKQEQPGAVAEDINEENDKKLDF